MPDDVVTLPGIDPAPAAAPAPSVPSASPAAPPASAEAVPAEPAAPPADPAATPATPADGEPEGKSRRGNRVQDRINELTQERHGLQRQNAELLGMVRELVQGVRQGGITGAQAAQVAGVAGTEQPPQENQYTNWQDFLVAKASYDARQQIRRELAQAAQQHQEAQQRQQAQTQAQAREQATQRLHGTLSTQMRDAATRYPDYVDVVSQAVDELPLNVEAAMAVSGAGGDVAYYLAQHPEVVPQLARLPDMVLAHQIGRIATAMRSNASSSAAPPPGKPVGSRGSAPLAYPDNATPEQHIAWKKRMGLYGQTQGK